MSKRRLNVLARGPARAKPAAVDPLTPLELKALPALEDYSGRRRGAQAAIKPAATDPANPNVMSPNVST